MRFYLKDYINAENLFKGFVEAFPNSPKSDEMDYMRAYCFWKQSPKYQLDQTNTTKAMGFMQAFIAQHPNSDKVKEATKSLKNAGPNWKKRILKPLNFILISGKPIPAYLKAAIPYIQHPDEYLS